MISGFLLIVNNCYLNQLVIVLNSSTKNVICVGASESTKGSTNIGYVAYFSSQGPAYDQRFVDFFKSIIHSFIINDAVIESNRIFWPQVVICFLFWDYNYKFFVQVILRSRQHQTT